MKNVEIALQQAHPATEPEVVFDPSSPILHGLQRAADASAAFGQAQRQRRSKILATIRDLLTEHGLEGVTVRRIAEASGYAVQTIYNLVGPREEAIVEAICEYTRLVNYGTLPDIEDPYAVLKIIDRAAQSIEAAPEFCRQVCLIGLTSSREIFYRYRDRQFRAMRGFLAMQRKAGVLCADVDISDLAEQLILIASVLCMDWADRRLTMDEVRHRLTSSYANLMAGVANASVRLCPRQ